MHAYLMRCKGTAMITTITTPMPFYSATWRSEIPRLPIKHYKKYDTNNSNATATYALFDRPGDSIDNLSDISAAGFIGGINMTKVYLISPNIDRDYFTLCSEVWRGNCQEFDC